MWVLRLNDMRSPKIEIMTELGVVDTMQELADFCNAELVEPYDDGQWRKSYRQGGPLEWYNIPTDPAINFINIGDEETHVENVRQKFRNYVAALPRLK